MKLLFILSLVGIMSTIVTGQTQGIRVNEEIRQFTLYVPQSFDTTKKYPLVLNFHGSGVTAISQMFYTEMNKEADKKNFIVVYPQGQNNDWNVGFGMPYKEGVNDVNFIKELVTKIKKNYPIDDQSIFATGISRGGFFTYRLASELPGVFKAIATVGAPIPDSVAHLHIETNNLSVLQIHGDSDQIVNIDGKDLAYFSALKTAEYWSERNNIPFTNSVTRTITTNDQDTPVTIQTWSKESRTVQLVTIKNGGHTWPGADPFNFGLPLGKTTSNINATEYIWDFFEKQIDR